MHPAGAESISYTGGHVVTLMAWAPQKHPFVRGQFNTDGRETILWKEIQKAVKHKGDQLLDELPMGDVTEEQRMIVFIIRAESELDEEEQAAMVSLYRDFCFLYAEPVWWYWQAGRQAIPKRWGQDSEECQYAAAFAHSVVPSYKYPWQLAAS